MPEPMSGKTDVQRKGRVLFVHPTKSAFIQSDIDLLSRHFDLRVVDVGSRTRSLRNMVGAFWELLRGAMWADVAFCWFVERHTKCAVRISRVLGKPSVVVVGGYEVAKVPEIGHGSLLDPKKAKMVKHVLERATAVLAVSEFSRQEILACSRPRRVEVLHNGVDAEKFRSMPPKEDLVVTVGAVSKRTLRLKGIETFVASAASVPDARFLVVGPCSEDVAEQLKQGAPKNVSFRGFVPHEELLGIYGKAKVYCQLSRYESFGVALVEAMSCECVPVVTACGALPEIVGDAGFIVPWEDVQSASRAIQQALRTPDGKKARERAMNMFSMEIRERGLVRIVGGLIRGP
jgi:glycosyltransferase involved in cell wall biosynthesis